MLKRGKIPCTTTRCFNPKIHPKKQRWDAASFRLQVRKHPKVTIEKLSEMLGAYHKKTWISLFKDSLKCSVKGNTLVATWRFFLTLRKNYKGWMISPNMDTGEVYAIRQREDGKKVYAPLGKRISIETLLENLSNGKTRRTSWKN